MTRPEKDISSNFLELVYLVPRPMGKANAGLVSVFFCRIYFYELVQFHVSPCLRDNKTLYIQLVSSRSQELQDVR